MSSVFTVNFSPVNKIVKQSEKKRPINDRSSDEMERPSASALSVVGTFNSCLIELAKLEYKLIKCHCGPDSTDSDDLHR